MLSPEKNHEKLCLLGIKRPPAPNIIAKYIPTSCKPPSRKQIQSWKTFIINHQAETWATDYFTIPSLNLRSFMD
jgi:putative transposase